MLWIVFSLLAAVFFAIVNTTDKFALGKWIKNPMILLMAFGVTGLIMAGGVWVLFGISQLSDFHVLVAFLAGLFFILSSFFYLQSLKREEVSKVMPLMALSPLFVLILASFFLGEVFPPGKYLGVFLLVAGALMISSKGLRLSFGKGAVLMMLSALAFGAGNTMTKYLLGFADYWTVFSYIRIGSFIAIIPVLHYGFRDLKAVARSSRKIAGVVFFNRFLGLTALLLVAIAASSGEISLVSALSSAQTLFLFGITLCLSRCYPQILKEEFHRKALMLKLAATAIMFIGVLLIV